MEELKKQARPAPQMNEVLAREVAQYSYRVGPRDVLRVTVWDHPELTAPSQFPRSPDTAVTGATNEVAGQVVAADGTIFVPYYGPLHVAGKTVNEVRELMTKALARYIKNPQIDIRVVAFRSQMVQVLGEVGRPGPVSITDLPLTAVDAVNLAGGSKSQADLGRVTVTRNGRIEEIDLQRLYDNGDIAQNRLLRDGDIVHVPDHARNKVFVFGEVSKPSSQFMNKGRMTLAEALGDAGGVNQITSNPGRIYVIRGDFERPNIFRLDAGSPDALLLAQRFPLEPLDVVYVATAEITRWNRVISQMLPTIQVWRVTQ